MSISCIRLSIDSASMLTTLINQFDLSLGSALKCYNPILMPSANRSTIRDLFMKVKRPDTVYARLLLSQLFSWHLFLLPMILFFHSWLWWNRYCGIGINDRVILSLQNKSFPLSPASTFWLIFAIPLFLTIRSNSSPNSYFQNSCLPYIGGLATNLYHRCSGQCILAFICRFYDGWNVCVFCDHR